MTADALMRAIARRYGGRVAAVDRRRSLTYGELYDGAVRMANGLRLAGVVEGDRVALHAEDTVEALQAYTACWLAGCTAVHVSARLAVPEVQHVLTDADVRAYCHSSGLRDVVAQVSGLEDLRCVRCIDAGEGDAPVLTSDSTEHPPQRTSPADPAIIGYTSGTSGRPKGAMVSHRALVLSIWLAPYHFRIPLGSRLAYSGSISFIGSFWGQVLPHLYVGGTVRFLAPYDPESWFDAMRRDRSTFTFLPTPMMPDFVDGLRRDDAVRRSLVTVMHAGSQAARPHVEAAVDVLESAYLETWGLTEVVGSLTATTISDVTGGSAADDILASVGRAVPSARVWAVRDDGTVADAGEEGELVAEVDTVFDGYWRDPAKTAGVLRDGVFSTGDAGYLDSEGYVYITGRRSDLIITGGANVYPAEVERVLLTIPGIRQAAVVGVPDARWGEAVAAGLVLERGASITLEAILLHCRKELAGYKKPTRVEFYDHLPQTGSQKIDRHRLKEMLTTAP